jgi:hypothetical protein
MRAYIAASIPAMLWGAPGVGKSEAVAQLALEDCASLYETRLSLYESVDLHGLPHILDGNVVWAMPDMFATLWRMARENPGKPIYWFLDEVNVALPAVMAAAMQLVLNRRLGPHDLPTEVQIIAAGNKQSHRSSANRMPVAFASRFGHVEVEPDYQELYLYAIANGWGPEMPGFFKFRPALIHQMPANDDPAFPNPRSWERVARGFRRLPDDLRIVWVKGLVGAGAASEFETYITAGFQAPKLEDIIRNPTTHPVPGFDNPALQCAVAQTLAMGATRENLEAITLYANRMPKDLNVMVMVDATARNKTLQQTRAFTSWVSANQDVQAA